VKELRERCSHWKKASTDACRIIGVAVDAKPPYHSVTLRGGLEFKRLVFRVVSQKIRTDMLSG